MKESFRSQVKEAGELKKFNFFDTIAIFPFFAIIFYSIRVLHYDVIYSTDYQYILLYEIFWPHAFLMAIYFSSNVDSSYDSKYKSVGDIFRDKTIHIPKIFLLLSLMQYIFFYLIFFEPSNPIFWILRSTSEILLLIAITNHVNQTTGKSIELRFPITIILLEMIRLITIISILFLMDLTELRVSQLYYSLLLISTLVFSGLVFLEYEREKYRQFTIYKHQFATTFNSYQRYSFTGFMANIPDNLARTNLYLNVAMALLGSIAVGIWIAYIILLSVTTSNIVIQLVVVATILIVLVFLVVNKSRDSTTVMMNHYAQVMDYFVAHNRQLFDVLNSEVDNQSE